MSMGDSQQSYWSFGVDGKFTSSNYEELDNKGEYITKTADCFYMSTFNHSVYDEWTYQVTVDSKIIFNIIYIYENI